jgi:DegV family protein with EDD domain
MSIKIVTDSTAYIPKALLEQYDIRVISLSVLFGDEAYKETEISYDVFYKKLVESSDLPTSSQPILMEVQETFESVLREGHDLIGVFISSEMSGTYQSAVMISEELKAKYPDRKICMIDSRSNCMQLGLSVLKGAEIVSESFDTCVETIEYVISHSRFVFIPETLEFLKRGGRIGSAKALLSSMLQIKPILTVEDGKTSVINKVRTRKKAISALIDIFRRDQSQATITGGYVHHINCDEDAKDLSDKLGESFDITAIGPVIGTHVGPGAIGIAYCWE